MRILVIIMLILVIYPTIAQEDDSPPAVITSQSITSLQSVYRIDFATGLVSSNTTNADGSQQSFNRQINFGWFVHSPNSERLLLLDDKNRILEIDYYGTVTHIISENNLNLVDGVPFASQFYALLLTTRDGFEVWYDSLGHDRSSSLQIFVSTDAIPSAIWVNCEDTRCTAYIEAFTDDDTVVYQLPQFDTNLGENQEMTVNARELPQRDYAPSSDDDAVVRIGRIPLPYVVTSSLAGDVTLWQLTDNQQRYQVNNNLNQPSVFGNINADATHLVWRDNANQMLYLLNFETGENREITSLNGAYAQWYFLSNDASVIIAVNLGNEPNIIAWDVATGEQTPLGNYRECERPQPDMVRLSPDGSTLVIGCDTGIDIWQIVED